MTTKKFTPIIKRGPRLTPGEINVTPPDDLGVEIPPSGIQKALPWVMGGGMLGMIAIMIFTGIRQLSPYMLMMPLMMIMATVLVFLLAYVSLISRNEANAGLRA